MRTARTSAAAASTATRYQRIYEAVARIPRGRVASYGAIARAAGLPGGARLVGRALSECPAWVPWHRVVNAAGRIALPERSAAGAEQRRRLRAEGVVVNGGRVGTPAFVVPLADLDALLWGPRDRGRREPVCRGER
ncbi:MAG: MGMT family protein [Gammaproteobacteria bacterium]|nr:MAG: MGMT family protein [Gammaproteobacteria bacterium]